MINIQNIDDNECFKWSIVRYVNPGNHHPARITKADKDFAKKLDFKGIKFPVKIRITHKIEKKKNSIGISVFGYENKEKHAGKKNMLIYYSYEKKDSFLLQHRGRKDFCCYYLEAFSKNKY